VTYPELVPISAVVFEGSVVITALVVYVLTGLAEDFFSFSFNKVLIKHFEVNIKSERELDPKTTGPVQVQVSHCYLRTNIQQSGYLVPSANISIGQDM